MTSNIARRSLFASAILGLTMAPAFADDAATTIKRFNTVTPILVSCTKTVLQVAPLRPPANHAAARLAAATNAAAGASKIPIPPEHQQFMDAMDAGTKALDACAAQLAPYTKMSVYKLQVNAALKKAGSSPTEWSKADAMKVADAMKAYDKAHQDFVQVLPGLSGDPHLQSYQQQSVLRILDAFEK
jgi:hypothetical protein